RATNGSLTTRLFRLPKTASTGPPPPARATGTPLAGALTAGTVAGVIPTELVAGPGRTVLLDITTLDPDEGTLVARIEARLTALNSLAADAIAWPLFKSEL